MSYNQVSIRLVQGNVGPRYTNGEIEVICDEAVVTEKGMQSGLPFVDFVGHDASGKKYVFTLTARVLALITGVAISAEEREL